MKKVYIKPTIKVHQIKKVDIICGSGEAQASIYNSIGNIGVSQNGSYTGIWGE